MDWCEDAGRAPVEAASTLMGTHNRLLGLGDGASRMYLEIIALDPEAPGPHGCAGSAWIRGASRGGRAGPRLCAGWRAARIDRSIAALRDRGHDPGEAIAAER